jgi:hypothetical protein
MLRAAWHYVTRLPMFHVALFALLSSLLLLFAFSAARAGQFVVAVPAALVALWLVDGAVRALRGARRARADGTGSDADGRQ